MDKYAAQKKHMKANYKRFPLDLKVEVLEEFKDVCKANGTTPTTVIKAAIAEYVSKHK